MKLVAQEVYFPLLSNANNRLGWSGPTAKDVMLKFSNFLSTVSMTAGQSKGKTILPPAPAEAFDEDNLEVKERCQLLETSVVQWTDKIQTSLSTSPENDTIPGTYPDPLYELDFWDAKAKDLQRIHEQLSAPEMKQVTEKLTEFKSNLVEGFANFEKKPEPRVEIVQTEQFDEDEDSESDPEEHNYTVKRKKVKSKPLIKEKVQCEMDDMNEKISDLDVKLNLLLEKLNDREETRDSKKTEEKNEMTNIYDLILFVIFGVFFLLLLESISKVVVKNATKLNNANSLVFNN